MTILSSILVAVSALSLTCTNDYLWCTGSAPYRIEGYGCGSLSTNLVNRGEDMAFLLEARLERFSIPISTESYGESVPKSYENMPFPRSAVEMTGDSLNNPWHYRNLARRTSGLGDRGNFISCVYDESSLINSMRECGNYFGKYDDDYIASNIFTSCRIDARRSPVYYDSTTNRMQRLIIRGDHFFGLYKDLHDNKGLCFVHSTFGNVGHVTHEYLEREGKRDESRVWEVITPTYWHDPVIITDSTNTSDVAFNMYWSDSSDGIKYRTAKYNGQSLVCDATMYTKTYTDNYTKPVGTAVIRFHPYMSNRIERIKTFAAFRVRRFMTTIVSGTANTAVEKDVIVLAPVGSTKIESAPDGGPRYSLEINMPRLAVDVADFAGVTYPEDTFETRFSGLEEPALPTPPPGVSYKNQYTKQTSIQDTLTVRLLKIYGIAKIIYHARELRN